MYCVRLLLKYAYQFLTNAYAFLTNGFAFLGIWEFFATTMCPFYTVKCFSSSLILPL